MAMTSRAIRNNKHEEGPKTHKQAWAVAILILMVSVTPSSLHPRVSTPHFYAQLMDVIIVIVGGVAYVLVTLGLLRFPIRFFVPLSWLLLTLAIIGVGNSPFLRSHQALSLLFPIFILLFSPLCAWILTKLAVKSSPDDFIYALGYAIAIVAVEYIVASVVGPMLGFRGGNAVNLGEARISGSLGNSVILHNAFLPALSIFLGSPQKRFSSLCIASCTCALLLTFSRASAAALILYSAYYFLLNRNISMFQRITMLLLASAVIAGTMVIAESALVSRLSILEDDARSQTLLTAWAAWRDNPLLGQGYSHLWPYWKRQGELIAGLRRDRTDGLFIYTDFGLSIWNPHSLVAYIAGEMGGVGLFLLLSMYVLVARQLLAASRFRGLAVALLVSATIDALSAGTYCAFPFTTVVWWMFSLALIESESVA